MEPSAMEQKLVTLSMTARRVQLHLVLIAVMKPVILALNAQLMRIVMMKHSAMEQKLVMQDSVRLVQLHAMME